MRRVHLEEEWLVRSSVKDIEMDCMDGRVPIFESLKQTEVVGKKSWTHVA